MTDLKIILVSAYSSIDRVVEKNGDILRFFNDDSRGYRDSRRNRPVILGGSTFRNLLEFQGTVIPGRTNIVVSSSLEEWSPPPEVSEENRNPHYFASNLNIAPMGVKVCRTMEDALKYATNEDRVFITGGRSTIDRALPLVDRLELTELQNEVQGSEKFPEIDLSIWGEDFMQKIYSKEDPKEIHTHTFRTYRRITSLDKQD
ncbi:hypothetical protein HOM13_02660 [Candidatus Woesearchaeota archaeon]|nr:hypothetical protein [Candidatus Woesearchaeota archaeon]MBT5215615.1 hypothetical protein [Candidatus Woesearchaeota archaeon]MBT6401958.1 hypothetical protein [Candidatus Woesearchaeota archaeon]